VAAHGTHVEEPFELVGPLLDEMDERCGDDDDEAVLRTCPDLLRAGDGRHRLAAARRHRQDTAHACRHPRLDGVPLVVAQLHTRESGAGCGHGGPVIEQGDRGGELLHDGTDHPRHVRAVEHRDPFDRSAVPIRTPVGVSQDERGPAVLVGEREHVVAAPCEQLLVAIEQTPPDAAVGQRVGEPCRTVGRGGRRTVRAVQDGGGLTVLERRTPYATLASDREDEEVDVRVAGDLGGPAERTVGVRCDEQGDDRARTTDARCEAGVDLERTPDEMFGSAAVHRHEPPSQHRSA
jgi:hypothetical protein